MAKALKKARQQFSSNYTKKGGLQFGNQDADQLHDLSELNVQPDKVVVRHWSYMKMANGQEMEDPSTSRIQVYEPETYERLSDQGHNKGEQKQNYFEANGMGFEVLHMPE